MDKFTVLNGLVAPLDRANVDTDQIIPKQYLASIKRTGFGEGLFADWRKDPAFVLNQPRFKGATILLARKNFGCGSSREHAPWALLDFGIRAVIAPSFAEIFHGNCFRNGMLPVRLAAAEVDALMEMSSAESPPELTVSLVDQTVTAPSGWRAGFAVDPDRREALLNGLDEVGFTLSRLGVIDAFEERHWADKPWLRPG
jgi:3-isopropylmalate/(R)-2-methylmalate dehydratase small subunit